MKNQKQDLKNTKKGGIAPVQSEFQIPYPGMLLAVAVMFLYASSINLGFTELDDSIFIKERQSYNEDLSNLVTSFKRGVFNETEDVYYRPILLNSFILNYQLSGTAIKGYHVVNILLHLIAVLLLYQLLMKLRFRKTEAFLLTLFFAIHPVLTQAVAWIPGRNDTLLAVFLFTFFIGLINYSNHGKPAAFILQLVTLLLAFFTKETTVFAAPVALLLLVLCLEKKIFEMRSMLLYGSWLLAFILWYYVRSLATLKEEQMQFGSVLAALPSRLPVIVQYFGKIILPLNLNVFPITKDTSNVYGLIAVALIAAGLFFSKDRNNKIVIAGIGTFLLFLVPVLLVPASLNDQDFEHRLYLPIVGVLLLLTQTILFRNNINDKTIFFGGIGMCLVLAIINFNHQGKFKDANTFWTEAVKGSPNSAYANMMLGARLSETDSIKSEQYMKAAHALNPDEKYLNYYLGKMALDKDSIPEAEAYFLKEIKKSAYYECYFHMARIAFIKNDFEGAIGYLTTYLSKTPDDEQANNNLLLLYLQTNKMEEARIQLKRMRQLGLAIPPEAIERLK
ncbi:MAG: tetratricopeptide repeat protein [Chitinophagaceae bacterium]|nr:tetratricopeptide repeat protein [Chitinophagaceae bacterium]